MHISVELVMRLNASRSPRGLRLLEALLLTTLINRTIQALGYTV